MEEIYFTKNYYKYARRKARLNLFKRINYTPELILKIEKELLNQASEEISHEEKNKLKH